MSYQKTTQLGTWGESLSKTISADASLSSAINVATERSGAIGQIYGTAAKAALNVAVSATLVELMPIIGAVIEAVGFAVGSEAAAVTGAVVGVAVTEAAGPLALVASVCPVVMVAAVVAMGAAFVGAIFAEAGQGVHVVAKQFVAECVDAHEASAVKASGPPGPIDANGNQPAILLSEDLFWRKVQNGQKVRTEIGLALAALDAVADKRAGGKGIDPADRKALGVLRLAIEAGGDAGALVLPLYLDFVATQFRSGRINFADAAYCYLRHRGASPATAEFLTSATDGAETFKRVALMLDPILYMTSNTSYGVAGKLPTVSYPPQLAGIACWWSDLLFNPTMGLGYLPFAVESLRAMVTNWNKKYGMAQTVSTDAARTAAMAAAAKLTKINAHPVAVTINASAKAAAKVAPAKPKPVVARDPNATQKASPSGAGWLVGGLLVSAAALGGVAYLRSHPAARARLRARLARRP